MDPTRPRYKDGTDILFPLAPETLTKTSFRDVISTISSSAEYFVSLKRTRVGAFGPWLDSGTRLWALPGLGYDDVRYDYMRVVWP